LCYDDMSRRDDYVAEHLFDYLFLLLTHETRFHQHSYGELMSMSK